MRLGILAGLFDFLIKNKLWWLVPMIVFLMLFFALIILGQSSPLGPFIYTVF